MAETIKLVGIRKYHDGYQARASFTDKETGEVTRFNKSGFKTEIEAYNARENFLKSMRETGTYKSMKRIRFGDVFLEANENSGYKPATMKRHLSLYNNHIKNTFGDKYITKITAGEIENFLIKLSKPSKDKKFGKEIQYSQEYILGFYKTIKSVFSYALKHDYISDNVALKVGFRSSWFDKAKKKEEGRCLSPEELKVIDTTLKTSNLYTSFKLAIHTGMRISEIFGLLWEDIDFDKKVVMVRKQLLYDSEKKVWYFAPLKPGMTERIIPMPDELFVYLQDLRMRQLQEKDRLGECYRANKDVTGVIDSKGRVRYVTGLEFVNIKMTGERLTSDSTKYATRRVEATTGKHRFLLDPNDITSDIDFSYHDFRHTYATLCASNGVAVEDLQDILGHKKITTTKKFYLHKDLFSNPIRDSLINNIFDNLSQDIQNVELPEKIQDSQDIEDTPKDDEKSLKKIRSAKVLPAGKFVNGVFYEK